MGSPKTLLLTGANGYVGKHLLAALLHGGHRVVALIRRRHGQLEERLVTALEPFDRQWRGHLEVIEGDVTAEGCGLSASARERLRAVDLDGCIHAAGLTRFEEHLAEEIREQNLHGTRRVFELCRALAIPHFHHVSTAFVAGEHAAPFAEADLDLGQTFRNPYEQSKFDAEQYLRQQERETDIRIHIYRPSIVVGGFMLGESNSVGTVYTFLKSLHFIRQCCILDGEKGRGRFAPLGVRHEGEQVFVPLRLEADGDTTLNLVHIQQVTAVLKAGIERPENGFSVRHIVGGRDFNLDEVRRVFCGVIGMNGPAFLAADDFDARPRNALEERLYRATKSYRPYLHARPRFQLGSGQEQVNVDLGSLTTEFLHQLALKEKRKGAPNLGSLALECLGIDSPHHYFDKLVGREFGSDFLGGRDYIDASIRFIIHGQPAFDRTLRFSKGRAAYQPDHETAVCRYEMNGQTFHNISHSLLDPKQAFFKGLVKIAGDMETGLKFAHVLSDYYRHIDDHIIDELSEAC